MLNIPQICCACSYKNLDYHQTVSLCLQLMRKSIGTENCSLILLIFHEEAMHTHLMIDHKLVAAAASFMVLMTSRWVPAAARCIQHPLPDHLQKIMEGPQGFKTIGEWYGKPYGLGYGMVSEKGSNGMEILQKLGATKKQFESRESHGNNAPHCWVQLRVLHSFSKKQSENNTICTHHHCHVQIAQVFQSFSKKQSENQCT